VRLVEHPLDRCQGFVVPRTTLAVDDMIDADRAQLAEVPYEPPHADLDSVGIAAVGNRCQSQTSLARVKAPSSVMPR
jgi:hypothetical protein